MEPVGFRCPVGFKNYPLDLRVSTGAATSEGGRGACNTLDRAASGDSMKESDSDQQEFGEQPTDYSSVGRELLRGHLEENGAEAFVVLQNLGRKAGRGEFGERELYQLREIHAEIGQTLELVETEVFDGNLKAAPSDGGVTDE